MTLTLIGYSPYCTCGPLAIFVDLETNKKVEIPWLMNEIEMRWAEVFWHTGISLKEFKDQERKNNAQTQRD